jgi:hypothetical protein
MPPRRPPDLAVAFFVAVVGSSCGGSGDQTANFVGSWTFATGELTPMCAIAKVPPVDLTGLNVTFDKVDDSTLNLMLGADCNVKFHATGNKATVAADQTCTLDTMEFGSQTIEVTRWTLSFVGSHIENGIAGYASFCSLEGTGVLARGTTDAGARDETIGGDVGDNAGDAMAETD